MILELCAITEKPNVETKLKLGRITELPIIMVYNIYAHISQLLIRQENET